MLSLLKLTQPPVYGPLWSKVSGNGGRMPGVALFALILVPVPIAG